MGNVSGKDQIENGGGDLAEISVGDPAVRSRSVDFMGGSPPESPGRSRSPLMFAPQVPEAPLQRTCNAPSVNQHWMMNEPYFFALAGPREKGIPILITWTHGGSSVLLEGSWDNWASRKALQRSGKDHSILIVLPSGVYQYRFIVDGRRRYALDLPFVSNELRQFNNIINVHDYVAEEVGNVSEFSSPPSPESSYIRPFPEEEDFAKEPPALPPHLHLTVLSTRNPGEVFALPRHVILNHLFIEKGWSSHSLIPLGYTHRFQSKYVTVVLYKPAAPP